MTHGSSPDFIDPRSTPFAPILCRGELPHLYKEGGAAYGTLKKELVGFLWDYFQDAREERARLINDPGYIREVLAKGKDKVAPIAIETMDLVRKRVGIEY